MERTIAVIDIGMTNKKVAVYGGDLRLLDSVRRTFDPLPVDGIETHDLAAMEEWFLDSLRAFASRFDIAAVAVTTHGATMVCTDSAGLPVAPCVFYTHEPGPGLRGRFYAAAGDPAALQATTGTADLAALINPAKGLFFLRERFPAEYARTRLVLPFPQYWGMRLTGTAGAEGTYIGCHSYFWDWEKERYSTVVDALGIGGMIPSPLRDSWSVLGRITPAVAARTGIDPACVVTMGIHDSNASILPHLAACTGKDFILNSTGTWCVIMHPQEKYGFAPGELGKVVFFNRSAYNRPVKTAIFLGGREYETWSALAAVTSGSRCADPGAAAYPDVAARATAFILPEIVPGSGQFPGSRPRAVEDGIEYPLEDIESGRSVPPFMRDARKAMAILNLSLAMQTLVALDRAGLSPGTEVFTEGGFRNNHDYNAILAAALPRNSVYLTDMAEATSFGAAMTAVAALEGVRPDELAGRFRIDRIGVDPMPGMDALPGYTKAWMDLVARSGR